MKKKLLSGVLALVCGTAFFAETGNRAIGVGKSQNVELSKPEIIVDEGIAVGTFDSAAISFDNRFVAMTENGVIRIYDVKSNYLMQVVENSERIATFCWSPSNYTIAYLCYGSGSFYIYDMEKKTEEKITCFNSGDVYKDDNLQISKDGKYLAFNPGYYYGYYDKDPTIINLEKSKYFKFVIDGKSDGRIHSTKIIFCKNAAIIYKSYVLDNKIEYKLFDLKSEKIVSENSFEPTPKPSGKILFSDDGKCCLYETENHELFCLDLIKQEAKQVNINKQAEKIASYKKFFWNPTKRAFLVCSSERDYNVKQVYLYFVDSGKLVDITDMLGGTGIYDWSKNGNFLLCFSENKCKIIDVNNKSEIFNIKIKTETVSSDKKFTRINKINLNPFFIDMLSEDYDVRRQIKLENEGFVCNFSNNENPYFYNGHEFEKKVRFEKKEMIIKSNGRKYDDYIYTGSICFEDGLGSSKYINLPDNFYIFGYTYMGGDNLIICGGFSENVIVRGISGIRIEEYVDLNYDYWLLNLNTENLIRLTNSKYCLHSFFHSTVISMSGEYISYRLRYFNPSLFCRSKNLFIFKTYIDESFYICVYSLDKKDIIFKQKAWDMAWCEDCYKISQNGKYVSLMTPNFDENKVSYQIFDIEKQKIIYKEDFEDDTISKWSFYYGAGYKSVPVISTDFSPNNDYALVQYTYSLSSRSDKTIEKEHLLFFLINLKTGERRDINVNASNVLSSSECSFFYSNIFWSSDSGKIFLDFNEVYTEYNNENYIIDVPTAKVEQTYPFSRVTSADAYFCDNNNKILICDFTGNKLELWDIKTGKKIASFIFNNDDETFLIYTPEGFFAGSEALAKERVHIVDGLNVYGIDQFYKTFYRPDLVAAKIQGQDISAYSQRIALSSVVNSGKPPLVQIQSQAQNAQNRDFAVEIYIENAGGGVGPLFLELNGKKILLSESLSVGAGETVSFSHTVTLQNGENKIEAYAYNAAGQIEGRHSAISLSWDGATQQPDLHVLAIGVDKYRDGDLWLNYAVADASAILENFKNQRGGLYKNIHTYSLFDADVTKPKIAQKFADLSEKIKADDVFVFYISGHGTAYDADGDYYFIPADFRYTGEEAVPKNGVSKMDLNKYLSGIKAEKTLVLLDTCNSGAFISPGAARGFTEKTAIERLARATGHATISAASKAQSAMEGYNGHGVFTWVLTQGLSGKADGNGDGFVSVQELCDYVETTVPELSYEKWGYEQVPQKALRNQDFPITAK